MPKGHRSVVKLAKAAEGRNSSARHLRRKARRIQKLQDKLQAKGYTFPKEPK